MSEPLDECKTPVIFKIDKDGEVFAAFPQMIDDDKWWHMGCYHHQGQHGGVYMEFVGRCRPAKPEQYADLFAELTELGYNLAIRHKTTQRDHKIRKALCGNV